MKIRYADKVLLEKLAGKEPLPNLTDENFPVTFHFAHNDSEVRVEFLVHLTDNSFTHVVLDMSFDEFNRLPWRYSEV